MESNFSSNHQIVDKQLGMTDITYSTAWELGRTLAIADRAFTAALNRLRHSVNVYATNATKQSVQGDSFVSKTSVISNLKDSIQLLADIPNQLSAGSRTVDPVRL
jgi:Holliday junction resolvasome RuvABC endonuclease subunit